MNSPNRPSFRAKHLQPMRVETTSLTAFKSQAKWDLVLCSELKLSEKFESVKRTIYGIGFTCVVIMGVEKTSRAVRLLYALFCYYV